MCLKVLLIQGKQQASPGKSVKKFLETKTKVENLLNTVDSPINTDFFLHKI